MPVETSAVEYRTVEIGAAYLVKSILQRLGVVAAIDQALKYQPEIATSYGQLAQVVIFNRMSLDPQPLYRLAEWITEHGIDRLLGIQHFGWMMTVWEPCWKGWRRSRSPFGARSSAMRCVNSSRIWNGCTAIQPVCISKGAMKMKPA